MNNLYLLYRYELKKMFQRKIVWLTVMVCMIVTGFSILSGLIGAYYVDGVKVDTHYHIFQTDQSYQKALSNRKINQSLLEEMVAGYEKIPQKTDRYITTEEYQKYARPYSGIFSFVKNATYMNDNEIMNWIPSETELYQKRFDIIQKNWEKIHLSEKEKAYWTNQENTLKIPFIYADTAGYSTLLRSFSRIGLLVLLAVSICVANIFTEEHTRKTDQLILCSVCGKNTAYWAKILTGASFAVGLSFLLSTFSFILTACFYGLEGSHAPFQLLLPSYSSSITIGQAVFCMYGILIITSAISSIIVMILSEKLRSSLAALAVSSVFLILGMVFSVPSQYRIFSQIWEYMPNCFLMPKNIFDIRLISIFGHLFTSWQAVPIIYILCSILLVLMGKYVYQNYQISGR